MFNHLTDITRKARRILLLSAIGAISASWVGGTAFASAGPISATTNFDSGGGAEVAVGSFEGAGDARADARIRVELTDPMGYPHKGYLHFKLENGADQTVFIEVTNIDDSRMPADHRLFYTTDLEKLDWRKMEHEIGNGFLFTLPSDQVYISNYHAYPYRNIVRRVEELARHPNVATEVIGQSHEGRDMHAIRIAAPDLDRERALDYVILTRQHSGEVQGSWHMDGAIDFILDVIEDPARQFADDYVFHLIPAANPDGIFHGIHRLDAQGHNLNRQWHAESPVEIAAIKNYLRDNVREVHWGLDLHSSTNLPFNYPAVWYDERAVDEEALEIIEELVEAVNSFDTANATASDSRSRGFIYREFNAVMVTTEVSTYWPGQTAESLREEGRAFIHATTRTVATD